MRVSMLMVMVLSLGCSKKDENASRGGATPAANELAIPRAAAGISLGDARWPSAIVWIGAAGTLEVTYTRATEGRALAGKRTPIADPVALGQAIHAEIAAAEAAMKKGRATGANPPPDPEAAPESERPEGEYKMKHAPDDPELARQQAIDQARQAGLLGDNRPSGTATGRLANAPASAIHDLEFDTPILVAAPTTSASVIARVAAQVGGVLAVSTAELPQAVLPIGFAPIGAAATSARPAAVGPWLELLGDARGVTLVDPETGKSTAAPWKNGTLDRGALDTLFGTAPANVDVLAGVGMTTQQLVDVLGLLHQRRDTVIWLGETAAAPAQRLAQIAEAKRADRVAHEVVLGLPNAQGDLPKEGVQKLVTAEIDKLLACYDQARTKHPKYKLKGIVSVQFFVPPSGKLDKVDALGVDSEVARCVADVIKPIVFPSAAGGTMVQLPITFAAPD